jgi:propanediol dehydratase large subunit
MPMKASVVSASGSDETKAICRADVALISEAIVARGVTIIDVIKALARRGFEAEAENLLRLVKLRITGDYLQTSAIVRDGHVISAINDPNEYLGPGTGYRLSAARRAELVAIRDVLTREEVLRAEETAKRRPLRREVGAAAVGIGPTRWSSASAPRSASNCSNAGHPLRRIAGARGIAEGGAKPASTHPRPTLRSGLPRLDFGSVSASHSAKGTAVIHHKDRQPHNNLELFCRADHAVGALPAARCQRRYYAERL